MRHRAALLAVLPLVLFPVAAASCGGSDGGQAAEPTPAAEGEEPLRTIAVGATEFEFDPDELSLERPGTYRFVLTNDGGAPHALEIEGNGVEAATDEIEGGERAELDVELPEGDYELYCPVGNHADQGMVGRIVVGSGGGTTTDGDDAGETTTGDGATETEEDEGATTTSSSVPGY